MRGILDEASTRTGPIIEDFCSPADSLDWRLGQRYWNREGSRAFSNAFGVPYTINNDGDLAKNCAELLFENLTERESPGNVKTELFVLEMGVGIGLFARLFLDWFHSLCLSNGKDYYDRLVYVAADRHERILQDLCKNGVFSNHPGHYLLRVVDAIAPGFALRDDLAFLNVAGRPFDAVFLNYILDCLPATILEVDHNEIKTLLVRTRLCDEDKLINSKYIVADLIRMAKSEDPRDMDELSELVGLMALEYGFAAPPAPFPYQEAAADFARKNAMRHLVHNYGALSCLHDSCSLLKDSGFILVSDYVSDKYIRQSSNYIDNCTIFRESTGDAPFAERKNGRSELDPGCASPGFHASMETIPIPRGDCPTSPHLPEESDLSQLRVTRTDYDEIYQAFAGSRAFGINFPLLKHYFSLTESLSVLDLERERTDIMTVVFHRGMGPAACRIFQQAWDGGRSGALDSLRQAAQDDVKAERYDRASLLYGTLLDAKPNNWDLIHEVARFLCERMNRNSESLIFAKSALALNPFGSPMLWNSLGDILCSLGRCDQALVAYKRAVRIDRSNVRSRINLAKTYLFLRNPSAALRQVCEGLSLCREGGDRDILLQIQRDCLLQADRQHTLESMRPRLIPRSFVLDRHSGQLASQRTDGGNVLVGLVPEA